MRDSLVYFFVDLKNVLLRQVPMGFEKNSNRNKIVWRSWGQERRFFPILQRNQALVISFYRSYFRTAVRNRESSERATRSLGKVIMRFVCTEDSVWLYGFPDNCTLHLVIAAGLC